MKKIKPITPSTRFLKKLNNRLFSRKIKIISSLVTLLKKRGGRNFTGQITVRHRGGGHKKFYRIVDFKRAKVDLLGLITRIEYDPNRNCKIALVLCLDGYKYYIICPKGLKISDSIINSNSNLNIYKPGYSYKIKFIPTGVFIHLLEFNPNSNKYLTRSAGAKSYITGFDNIKKRALIKLPSGELRFFNFNCRATIGVVGNDDYMTTTLGKAGRSRWLGIRPTVRGVAMNPVDHPMGGGEGKTSGGRHPVSK
jgi:large subunit ribosomal protein L2